MRLLFATLGLLVCLIATRANDLPVIKDSEAIHYVGKKVEARGRVVSVTTSPWIEPFAVPNFNFFSDTQVTGQRQHPLRERKQP